MATIAITNRTCAAPSCSKRFAPIRSTKRFCSRACQTRVSNIRTNALRRSPEVVNALRTPTIPFNRECGSLSLPDSSVAPSKHSIGDRIRIWVDDPQLGCGDRYLIVTSIGPTRVPLYSAAALLEITVDRREFEQHARPHGSNAATVLTILKRNLELYERLGLDHAKPLDRAVEAMRREEEAA